MYSDFNSREPTTWELVFGVVELLLISYLIYRCVKSNRANRTGSTLIQNGNVSSSNNENLQNRSVSLQDLTVVGQFFLNPAQTVVQHFKPSAEKAVDKYTTHLVPANIANHPTFQRVQQFLIDKSSCEVTHQIDSFYRSLIPGLDTAAYIYSLTRTLSSVLPNDRTRINARIMEILDEPQLRALSNNQSLLTRNCVGGLTQNSQFFNLLQQTYQQNQLRYLAPNNNVLIEEVESSSEDETENSFRCRS